MTDVIRPGTWTDIDFPMSLRVLTLGGSNFNGDPETLKKYAKYFLIYPPYRAIGIGKYWC